MKTLNTIKIKLWNRPYNGGWVWFDRRDLFRFNLVAFREEEEWGCRFNSSTVSWRLFGFCGYLTIQNWPWQKKLHEGWPWNRNGLPKKVD